MSAQHFTHFQVENFKRFDSLELTDIGQFNLLVGDNNVGKTSLLEGLAIFANTTSSEIIARMANVLEGRNMGIQGHVELFFKYLSKSDRDRIFFKFSRNKQNFSFKFKEGLENKVQGSGLTASISSYPAVEVVKSPSITPERYFLPAQSIELPLIRTTIPEASGLVNLYQNTINFSLSVKKSVISSLKVIDKGISAMEILPIGQQQHVMIGFETGNDLYMPISSLGESAVRAFYYFLQIIKNQGRFLCIDEIDTGIHYSRMKQFLKQVIQAAVENDVQLFLTTHSLECQTAFEEVFELPDMVQYQPKVRQYTLLEKADGGIVASVRNFEQLQSALGIGYETRGGHG